MLSKRGIGHANSQDIPWRFAPGGDNRYDKITNPEGVVPFGTAENVSVTSSYKKRMANQLQSLVHEELQKFVAENVSYNPRRQLTFPFCSLKIGHNTSPRLRLPLQHYGRSPLPSRSGIPHERLFQPLRPRPAGSDPHWSWSDGNARDASS
jgi:hypothetical protein